MVPFSKPLPIRRNIMLVEFYYRNKKNETKLRKVLVIRDCNSCFEGIDVNLLETEERLDLLKKIRIIKTQPFRRTLWK